MSGNNKLVKQDDIDAILTDEQLQTAHILLRTAQIKQDIFRDIRRGCYQSRWLIDRYTDDMFSEEDIRCFIEEMREFVVEEHTDFDPSLEITGYLATNTELKRTMFDLLDSFRRADTIGFVVSPKVVSEMVKTIAALDKDRMDFVKFAGLQINGGGKDKEQEEKSDNNNILKVTFEQSTGTALKIRNSGL